MDEDGFAGGGGNAHLGDEGLLLDVDRGVVEVVVVEANFADGDALRVLRKLSELGEGFGVGLVGLLGVDAGGGEDAGVGVGEVESAVHGGRAVADAYGEDLMDTGGVGGGEDGGGIVVEVEVCVGVDEHGFQ